MNSPENILRSGVPHAVETNLVTRHAINPRHAFQDSDAPDASQANESANASEVSAQVHEASPPAPVIDADHLQDNLQSVGSPAISDNWQSLGKTHLQDNLQSVPIDVMQDNLQGLGETALIEEKKLYLEKKSIRDNRQKVVDTPLKRAAPEWHTAPDTEHSERQGTASNAGPNSVANDWKNAAQHELEKALEDDALRARMQKLKATVRVVNNSLSELDHKP